MIRIQKIEWEIRLIATEGTGEELSSLCDDSRKIEVDAHILSSAINEGVQELLTAVGISVSVEGDVEGQLRLLKRVMKPERLQ